MVVVIVDLMEAVLFESWCFGGREGEKGLLLARVFAGFQGFRPSQL
jgi:hypothetical protein